METTVCDLKGLYDEWREPNGSAAHGLYPRKAIPSSTDLWRRRGLSDQCSEFTRGRQSCRYRPSGVPKVEPSIERRFNVLAERWLNDTRTVSSVTEMATHPAYQSIIGLGPSVLPCLLRCLEHEPAQWFWALKAITGADPVSPEQRGRARQMASAWLNWAKEQGISW